MDKKIIPGAVKFLPNRVWRVYLGGSGIDQLQNLSPAEDGHFPEEWIASAAPANNPQYPQPDQGLSKVLYDGREMLFTDYLALDDNYTLGAEHTAEFGNNPALLMKILDAAEQLPIQCHPTVPDAKKYFNSQFGKTEAWYVIGTRQVNGEEPYLLMGFNEFLDEELFRKEALSGAFPAGVKMLHKLPVKPGDCFLVKGGLAHAIGCGVTLIEVMEPSDLVIQPEYFCGSQRLSDEERWSGAAPEDALKCFNYTVDTPEGIREKYTPQIRVIDEHLQVVIPGEDAGLFEVQKLALSGSYTLVNTQRCHRAGVVTAGKCTLDDGGKKIDLPRGSSFFLPHALERCVYEGDCEIIFALPPLKK